MIDPSLPLQKAMFDALSQDAALAVLFGVKPRVFDHVPLDDAGKIKGPFPFIRIGNIHIVSDADPCHDPCTAYPDVDVWSRKPGKVEAKAIMARVCAILDTALTVEGFRTIGHHVDNGPRHLDGGDGLSSHSVATFRYRLNPIG